MSLGPTERHLEEFGDGVAHILRFIGQVLDVQAWVGCYLSVRRSVHP